MDIDDHALRFAGYITISTNHQRIVTWKPGCNLSSKADTRILMPLAS